MLGDPFAMEMSMTQAQESTQETQEREEEEKDWLEAGWVAPEGGARGSAEKTSNDLVGEDI
jgi:hypothetical protein